ncbi:MAG TPA: PfkB family carbohydrate kinase [bacterium]|nr:PfkB family carbohydrate kinase [bacterium]
MPLPMRLVTVGSVALDTLSTPHGKRAGIIGGAATHASVAASFFVPRPGIVGVVGADFPEANRVLLRKRGVDLAGLATAEGKTFHWTGSYDGDMAVATTLSTELGVFADFDPKVPRAWLDAPFLFLANIEPGIQGRVLDQMKRPRFSLLDTMNLWIATRREALLKVVKRVDAVVLNDQEIRQLTGEHSLIKAAAACLRMGPKTVFLKRGEHGASLIGRKEFFHLPAYPTAKVVDPTGAGDSFAGGLMGWLADKGKTRPKDLRRAMAAGVVLSSFQVEGFSLERTVRLKASEIAARLKALRAMTEF